MVRDMKKWICPYCYREHTVLTCQYTCTFPTEKGVRSVCSSGGVIHENGLIDQACYPKCLKCRAYEKTMLCPYVNGGEIPPILLEGDYFPVAMIGTKNTTKSTYISVLWKEMRRHLPTSFNSVANIASDPDDFYRSYQEDLQNGRLQTATDMQLNDPLIFSLRFLTNSGSVKTLVNLTLRDISGDAFVVDDHIPLLDEYITTAKGIILFIDPLQVPAVRAGLGAAALENIMDVQAETDIPALLQSMIDKIRKQANYRKQIDIPLAVVVTKSDLLERFGMLKSNSRLREESAHLRDGHFVLSDLEETQAELLELLTNWYGDELLLLMKQFSHYAVFGMSPLGFAPSKVQFPIEQLHSRRILDPLLWMLAQNKYIKTVKAPTKK